MPSSMQTPSPGKEESMTSSTILVPAGEGFTVADWLALPEDGLRYELIDGSYHVTPAPTRRHQRTVHRLLRLLGDVLPEDLTTEDSGAGLAPADVTADRALIPDILVARRGGDHVEGDTVQPGEVVLAVEVVSRSTRRRDHHDKREVYADWGIPHYWIVDPSGQPRITCLTLRGGTYVEQANGEVVQLSEPFPVTVDAAQILGE